MYLFKLPPKHTRIEGHHEWITIIIDWRAIEGFEVRKMLQKISIKKNTKNFQIQIEFFYYPQTP